MSLRDLARNATPGPWESPERDYLAALCPEIAELLCDMADALRDLGYTRYGDEPNDSLLARFAEINNKAGQ